MEKYIEILNEKFCKDSLMAFVAWYDNGHTNEDDPNTIILRMKLTDGILFSNGMRYEF